MNDNERIIEGLKDGLATMRVLRTHLELVRHRLIKGLTNPETRVVSFDVDAMEVALLEMQAQEKIISSLLVEYKARQDWA